MTSGYDIPDGWRVANGLLPTSDPDVRYARDYDTFIDAPTILGIFMDGRKYEVVGVFDKKESAFGGHFDNYVLIPITTYLDIYGMIGRGGWSRSSPQ